MGTPEGVATLQFSVFRSFWKEFAPLSEVSLRGLCFVQLTEIKQVQTNKTFFLT